MDFKTLKTSLGVDNIRMKVDADSAIVTVNFTWAGIPMQALFSSDNEGLFGFAIEDADAFFKLVNNNPIAVEQP